jgi:hypothetical protein
MGGVRAIIKERTACLHKPLKQDSECGLIKK